MNPSSHPTSPIGLESLERSLKSFQRVFFPSNSPETPHSGDVPPLQGPLVGSYYGTPSDNEMIIYKYFFCQTTFFGNDTTFELQAVSRNVNARTLVLLHARWRRWSEARGRQLNLSTKLDAEELVSLEQWFAHVDRDDSGNISPTELKHALQVDNLLSC